MGKRSDLFSAVKKVLNHESLEKKAQENDSQSEESDQVSSEEKTTTTSPRLTPAEAENEQNQSESCATQCNLKNVDAESAEEVAPLSPIPYFHGNSNKDLAAVKIQTVARGHMARRAFMEMKGSDRLRIFLGWKCVEMQVTSALRSMKNVVNLHSQCQARRKRMTKENQSLHRQIQQKQEKKNLESQVNIDMCGWSSSPQSKEKADAMKQHREEAALRREKALAYAHSQQQTWKNASKSCNSLLMDATNPQWGWSWMERWVSSRPWENLIPIADHHHDDVSLMSATSHGSSSKPSSSSSSSKAPTKTKPRSHRRSTSIDGGDSKCKMSVVSSKHKRRHSIGQSYGIHSQESAMANSSVEKNGMVEKGLVGTAKKTPSNSDSRVVGSRTISEIPRIG